MKKFTSAFAALAVMGSAFAGAVTPAHAQTYTGTVDVFKGIALNCTASIELDGAGSADVSITAPEPSCAALNITSNPHAYTLVGTALTIIGVRVETITAGNCFGDLNGDLVGSDITVDDVLPPETGVLPCSVVGIVSN